MTPKERLQAVQDRLVAQGVTDVKFAWAENIQDFNLDEVCTDAADMLEAYLDGRCTPMEPFGDSELAHSEV